MTSPVKAIERKADLRSLKTRDLILETFRNLLETVEFPDITVSLIAREARISRKTFYAHFPSTNELLHEFAMEAMSDAVASVRLDQSKLTIDGWVRQFVVMVLVTLKDNPYLNSNIVRRIPVSTLLDVVRGPLEAICAAELQRRGIEATPDLEPLYIFFIGGICSVFEAWSTSSLEDASLERIADTLGESMAVGLATFLGERYDSRALQKAF